MSGCKTVETTNEALSEVAERVEELIGWAEADAEHAEGNDASETADDDRWRAAALRRALILIRSCER